MNHIDTLKLDLTNACNERCFFCPYHGVGGEISEQGKRKKPIQRLEKGDVGKMMSDLDGGVRRVKLSGSGETTLHPQFQEIVRLIGGYNVFVKLITNGTTLGRHAEFIREHVDDLTVSIHGDAETHDRVVGLKGAHKRAVSGLQNLKDLPGSRLKRTQISYVLNKDNLESAEQMMELSRELQIPVIFYFDFNPQDHGPVDMDRLLAVVKKIRENKFYISPPLNEEEVRRFFSEGNYVLSPNECGHVLQEVEVMATGDVYVCRSEMWGNIHETGILEILSSQERKGFLETIAEEARSKEGLCAARCDRCCYQHPPLPKS